MSEDKDKEENQEYTLTKLIKKAGEASLSSEALEFSQAALNIANAELVARDIPKYKAK